MLAAGDLPRNGLKFSRHAPCEHDMHYGPHKRLKLWRETEREGEDEREGERGCVCVRACVCVCT